MRGRGRPEEWGDCASRYGKRKNRNCNTDSKPGVQPFPPVLGLQPTVFRNTESETVGPKNIQEKGPYMNYEYFSYHNMSYYDIHVALKASRR